MPLPLGEVAERSEDGEGISGCNTLSVACGDSSPRGRAKGVCPDMRNGVYRYRYAPFTVCRDYDSASFVTTMFGQWCSIQSSS